MQDSCDVVVVGAGHNGLCVAALLARVGLDVVVVERREVPGGAASTEELVPGFRFSTCAYALHVLHEEVVREIGLELDVLPLPPRAAVLPDGTVVHSPSDNLSLGEWERDWDAAAEAVDPFLLGPAPAWDELARAADALGVGRFATASLRRMLEESLEAPEARALAAPRYFAGSIDEPGGPLAYAYLETGRRRDRRLQGLPRGGMGEVGAAFARAAERAGARIELGAQVREILVRQGRAQSVRLAGGVGITARAVVSNVDPARTLLLAGREPPEYVTVPPGAKLHCALRGSPDLSRLGGQAGIVHVYPSLDWYDGGIVVELQLPTLLDPSLAPPGGHCLTAYVPFVRGPVSRDLLLRVVADVVPNLDDVLVEAVLHDSAEITRRTGLPDIHHVALVPSQTGDRRPGPRTEVERLFLCGAGTHPGGEVSGVPGFNAARAVIEELSSDAA